MRLTWNCSSLRYTLVFVFVMPYFFLFILFLKWENDKNYSEMFTRTEQGFCSNFFNITRTSIFEADRHDGKILGGSANYFGQFFPKTARKWKYFGVKRREGVRQWCPTRIWHWNDLCYETIYNIHSLDTMFVILHVR